MNNAMWITFSPPKLSINTHPKSYEHSAVENFPDKNFAFRKNIRKGHLHFYYTFPPCPDIPLCLPLMGIVREFLYWYTLMPLAWCFPIIGRHLIDYWVESCSLIESGRMW